MVCEPRARATALLVCAGDDGVAVAADSLAHWSGADRRVPIDKLVVAGERVVVAGAGLLSLKQKTHLIFDQMKWVSGIVAGLGPRPGANTVARALVAAARTDLPVLATHESVKKTESPSVILLIAGFESAPKLWRVDVALRPFAVTVAALPFTLDPIGVGFGPEHLAHTGPLWPRLVKRLPWAATRAPATLDERAQLCGQLTALETELNPLTGRPVHLALIRRRGAVERATVP